MKISIRTSKHQDTPMTDGQLDFAVACIKRYKGGNYMIHEGSINNEKMGCDICTTKTQISAVVYHG